MTVGENLIKLWTRADASLDRIAKDGGYSAASSLQRYFTNEYNQKPRDIAVKKIAKGLSGKGNPPITAAEVWDAVQADDDPIYDSLRKKSAESKAGGNPAPTLANMGETMRKRYQLAVDMLSQLPGDLFNQAVNEAMQRADSDGEGAEKPKVAANPR